MKLLSALFIAAMTVVHANAAKPITSADEMNHFVDKLMSRMTLDEKIGQLNLLDGGDMTTGINRQSNVLQEIEHGNLGALFNVRGVDKIREIQRYAVEKSRLKIPLIFGQDVIHGYKTTFPIPLAQAASWDMNAIEQAARISAHEASASGICWTFSPMLDISRDPRWGRVAEGVGEDPYLGGEIGAAMVRGYQGDNTFSSDDRIMACIKHYALYGASEAGRDYNTVDMSRIRMYNEYLPTYKRAVEEGAGSIMASFNEVDGIPATANKWLMTDVLRNQWKFSGFVVTDYTGIAEMIHHGIGDLQEVSARALEAGVDMDMVSGGFIGTLKASLKSGRITERQIDQACRRILEAKYKLGLFANPYKYCKAERADCEIYTAENRATARRFASDCFVLLRNENQLLPLVRHEKIAVVGALANSPANMPGTWSVTTDLTKVTTVLEGLRSVAGPSATIEYARGCNIIGDESIEKNGMVFGRDIPRDGRTDSLMQKEAVELAKRSDVVVAVLGETSEMSGECASRSEIGIPDVQERLLRALVATGKPVVLVLFTGRPMTIQWESEHVPAILNVWFGGTEAGYAIADVLFGDASPSGKLPSTFPRNVGQIPIYYNHKNTGRPLPDGKWFMKYRSNYLDVPNAPTYPFGYGLTYTTFTYGKLQLSATTMTETGFIRASIDVTNSGKRDGKEIVELYIHDKFGSITRPVKELKGFRKLSLKAGETQCVTFNITPEMLKFYDSDLQYVCEKGDFEVMVGSSSDNVQTMQFSLQ